MIRHAIGDGKRGAQPPKLLDRVRLTIRARQYSIRTEEAYMAWIKRFIVFHGKRHPMEMGEPEINAFLTHLAMKERVSASTQNQALSALLFLYRHVLGREVGELGSDPTPRRQVAYGLADVWRGAAADGMPAASRAGYRLRQKRNHGSGRQRR